MSDKSTMFSFGREWPLNELPRVEALVTITLPDRPLDEIRQDIERRLAGLDAEIQVRELTVLEIPEPHRTEYHRLQDEVYQGYLTR